MRLWCRGCRAIQGVTTADEADEDPRTRDIRQRFRAEHLASCGDGAVEFQLLDSMDESVNPRAWDDYLASVQPPSTARFVGEFFANDEGQRLCEACWRPIPAYEDFPQGLASPDSDGAGGAVPKLRLGNVATDDPRRQAAMEHLFKGVCVPCYRVIFQHVYPGVALPTLSETVR